MYMYIDIHLFALEKLERQRVQQSSLAHTQQAALEVPISNVAACCARVNYLI